MRIIFISRSLAATATTASAMLAVGGCAGHTCKGKQKSRSFAHALIHATAKQRRLLKGSRGFLLTYVVVFFRSLLSPGSLMQIGQCSAVTDIS